MSNPFFDHPILNSPYEYPSRHWELDTEGQPTQQIIETRRKAEFITPIPKPKKRQASSAQDEMVFNEGKGLSTQDQQYDQTSIVNEVRANVNAWRSLPHTQWGVTPETARLLKHWREYDFSGVRPFFCQIEAVETAIWLTEVAPLSKTGKRILEHLDAANRDANPELNRLALKLATGARKTTVMAMFIAWQTINAVRRPSQPAFPQPPHFASATHFHVLTIASLSPSFSTSSLRVASAKGRGAVAARRGPCFFFMKARVDGAPFLIHALVTSLPFVSTAGRGAVPSGAAPAFFRGSFPSPFRKRKSRP